MVANASVLVQHGGVSMLSDPWYSGSIFNESWSLLAQPDIPPDFFDQITHIWISHEHPDHLHFPTLRSIPEAAKRKITLLYQRHYADRVAVSLRRLGFKEVKELPPGVNMPLGSGVEATCFPVGRYDSALLIRSPDATIFNANDCEFGHVLGRRLARKTGRIDLMLAQFSIAAWCGTGMDAGKAAAAQKLDSLRRTVSEFRPRHFVPFASMIYLSHEENRYMSEWANGPDAVLEALAGLPADRRFLYPGDSWDSEAGFSINGDATACYRQDFEGIPQLPFHRSETHGLGDIVMEGKARAEDVHRFYGRLRLRRVASAYLYVRDLDASVCFDIKRGNVEIVDRPREQCDIEIGSQALWFAFKHAFGMDTLLVSGRFTRIGEGNPPRCLNMCSEYGQWRSHVGRKAPRLSRRALAYGWYKKGQTLRAAGARMKHLAAAILSHLLR